jgi:hypothetical protein
VARRRVKDFEFRAIYEPDMERMVKALRILLEYNPHPKYEEGGRDNAAGKENTNAGYSERLLPAISDGLCNAGK